LWEPGSEHVWQARFYDFNVWTEPKRVEMLRYMHRNPVKRGLVAELSRSNGPGAAFGITYVGRQESPGQ
jgi:REP element-mobilizing transposase RayT